MKTDDLRLGNLVEVNGNVTEIDLTILGCIVENGNFAKPIQLTIEWLLKYGFKPIAESEEYQTANRGDIVFVNEETYYEGVYYISWGDNPMLCMRDYGGLIYIYSVHDLQNMYYFLAHEVFDINGYDSSQSIDL